MPQAQAGASSSSLRIGFSATPSGTTRTARSRIVASAAEALLIAPLQAMDRWSLHHLDRLDEATQARLLAGQFDALRRLLAPAPDP